MISKDRLASIRKVLDESPAPAYRVLCDELLEEVARLRLHEESRTGTFWKFADALEFGADEPELTVSRLLGRASDAMRALRAASVPTPMILTCPACNARHIDEGEFATRPHKVHACQGCGLCWRPAVVPTVGVQFLPGFKNGDPR